MTTTQPLLEVRGLEKHFDPSSNLVEKVATLFRDGEKIRAVDGVDLNLDRNEVQGIIGESGCGKSTLLRTLLGLYDATNGEIRFKGEPVSEFTRSDWKHFRSQFQIIFQDPFNSLDPKFTVYQTLKEPLNIHDRDDKDRRIIEMLEQVELTPADKYIDKYPDQLSGGEKQRVSIARALILEPEVILADEPVSMLDVSTQASILRLLRRLTDEHGVSMLYISHDLSTVSYVCDTVNVMYLGRIIESAPTSKLIDSPKHPYTQALIKAIPVPDPHVDRERTKLEGRPAEAADVPTGCRFKDRCPERMPACDQTPKYLPLSEGGPDHHVACHLYYDHETEAAAPKATVTEGDQ